MEKVQNKDNIGNPYHDEEGKFTSADGVSAGSEPVKDEDTSFVVKPFDPNNIDDFFGSFVDSPAEKASSLIESSQPYASLLGLGKTRGETTLAERKAFLENSINEYDKKKIADLSENEINALVIAEKATVAPMAAQQRIDVLDAKKKELQDKVSNELSGVFNKLYSEVGMDKFDYSGLWITDPTLMQYETFSAKDGTGTSKIERKRQYYLDNIKKYQDLIAKDNEIIEDEFAFEDDIENAKNEIKSLNLSIDIWNKQLTKLDNFEKYGQLYLDEKEQINKKYVDEFEALEDKISEAKKNLASLSTPEFHDFVIQSKDLIAAYQDESAIYSQARKDKALWFKGANVIKQAEQALFPYAKAHFNSMTQAERDRVDDYKSGSSKFNEPLRSLNYTGYKSFGGATYSKAINELTSAIDKCVWPEDIWVQRGQPAHINCFNINGVKKSIASMTDAERQSLIGSVYIDNGFFSSGAGKGTGFSSHDLIINTYCPKGTKMLYAQYWEGYKNENEMILQRGYSYRITKIEKKGTKYFMDVEVLLNSDKNKPVGAELEEIGKKHYKGG